MSRPAVRLKGPAPWSRLWPAALLAALSCFPPTDRGGQIFFVVTGLPDELLVGDSVRIGAVVVRSAREVPNALVVFGSSAAEVLAVDPDGAVRALGVGSARITMAAVGYENAQTERDVRVRGVVEIDSVAPHTVHFGDFLTIYGVAAQLDSVRAFVGGVPAPVKRVERASAGARAGRLVVWVPVGAPSSAPVTIRIGTHTSDAADTVTVIQKDLYEPNDWGAPYDLGSLPEGFFDPELALEVSKGVSATDRYVFNNAVSRSRTLTFAGDMVLTLNAGQVPGPAVNRILTIDGRSGLYESGCRSAGLNFPVPTDTARVALVGMRSGTFTMSVSEPFEAVYETKPYALGIENGVTTALPPDVLEGNDYCDVASPVVGGGAPLSLSIHDPLDVDWLRFTATAPRVRIRADFPGPDAPDFALFQVDSQDSTWVGLLACTSGDCQNYGQFRVTSTPTSVELLASTFPVRYFLAVYSYYGVPIPYTLSITPVYGAAAAVPSRAAPAPPRRERSGRPHWSIRRSDPAARPR